VARHRPLVLLLCAVAALIGTARALTPAPAATRPVTVAAHDLGAGHVLAEGDLRTVDWPADLSPPPSGGSTATSLAGRTLTAAVRAGEPVTDARLLGPGTLAGQPPGTLAVPVRLADPTTAGIVSPGDHVDVIAGTAAEVPGLEPGPGSGPPDADVVAWDVVVLATPGRGDGPATGSGGGLSALTGGSTDQSSDAGGLLVVAADRATAVRLARAQAGRVLSVAVRGSPGGPPP
jgi:Flp pilus assembly protein CpaB